MHGYGLLIPNMRSCLVSKSYKIAWWNFAMMLGKNIADVDLYFDIQFAHNRSLDITFFDDAYKKSTIDDWSFPGCSPDTTYLYI